MSPQPAKVRTKNAAKPASRRCQATALSDHCHWELWKQQETKSIKYSGLAQSHSSLPIITRALISTLRTRKLAWPNARKLAKLIYRAQALSSCISLDLSQERSPKYQAEMGEGWEKQMVTIYIWHITVGKKPIDTLLQLARSWLSPLVWSQNTLIWESQIAKTKATCVFFFQFPFRVDIYACERPRMQEEEIVEFGKEEKEREKESPCSPTLWSTQLVPISPALPAWNLQESQRRCRIEKTHRQCFKRAADSPVVLITIATWFASWQILL